MKNSLSNDDLTPFLNQLGQEETRQLNEMTHEETTELKELEKKREKKYEPARGLVPEEIKQSRLEELKRKQQVHKVIWVFNLYQEPGDLYLMINDYLESCELNKVLPSVPWMLKYIWISKDKMKELLEIWDAYSEVVKEWLLAIEDVLLRKWLTSEITSKILPLYLKNYHWYTEKSEQTIQKKEQSTVNIIVKPAITDDIDWRLIDIEDAEIVEGE